MARLVAQKRCGIRTEALASSAGLRLIVHDWCGGCRENCRGKTRL